MPWVKEDMHAKREKATQTEREKNHKELFTRRPANKEDAPYL